MVKTFSRLITKVNRTEMANKKNEWIVIHYVGAVSSAEANARYFEKENRQASAHYFVDETSIWQVVEDKDAAWHVGGANVYYNSARNSNSIGIEMCCKKKDGEWYIEPETIDNTIWLTKMLMTKYELPVTRVTTHYLTTGKRCPEPFVRHPEQWEKFLSRLEDKEMDENEALEFLAEREITSNTEYWKKALVVTKNLNFLLIKAANYIKELEAKNGLK